MAICVDFGLQALGVVTVDSNWLSGFKLMLFDGAHGGKDLVTRHGPGIDMGMSGVIVGVELW